MTVCASLCLLHQAVERGRERGGKKNRWSKKRQRKRRVRLKCHTGSAAAAAWSRGLYLGDEAEEERFSLRSIVLAPSFYWPRHTIDNVTTGQGLLRRDERLSTGSASIAVVTSELSYDTYPHQLHPLQ